MGKHIELTDEELAAIAGMDTNIVALRVMARARSCDLKAIVASLAMELAIARSQLAELRNPGPRKRGPKPRGEAAERRSLRRSPEQAIAWEAKAHAARMPLSAWARMVWDATAGGGKRLESPPEDENAGALESWFYRATDAELAFWRGAADESKLALRDWQRAALDAA